MRFLADFCMIIHSPAKVGLKTYTEKELPVYLYIDLGNNRYEKKPVFYVEMLKNRHKNDVSIPRMLIIPDLKHGSLPEVNPKKFGEIFASNSDYRNKVGIVKQVDDLPEEAIIISPEKLRDLTIFD